jgi:hypothetical protein
MAYNPNTNITATNGVTLLTGNGVTGTGSMRVTIASDNTPHPVKVDQTTPGTTNAMALAQIGANTVLTGNGVTGTGSVRVTIASDNTPYAVKVDQTTPGTTNAISIAQLGANAILTGNGVTGTGSQRVTVASDNTPFAVKIDQTTPGTTNAVVQTPATPTAFALSSAATTNATSIKGSAGTMYAITCSNSGAAAAFVKLYNKATAPTVGTDVPILTIPVGASGIANINLGELGHRFSTGIALAITNLVADTDATAVVAAQVKVIADYI